MPTSSGRQCFPSNRLELDIGCFKTPEGTLSQIGDFTQEPDPDLAVANCGELAHYHGFQVFALGKGGLCLSGAEAKHRYHKHGTVPKHQCPFGIGKESNSFVYSFGEFSNYFHVEGQLAVAGDFSMSFQLDM